MQQHVTGYVRTPFGLYINTADIIHRKHPEHPTDITSPSQAPATVEDEGTDITPTLSYIRQDLPTYYDNEMLSYSHRCYSSRD